jgi:sortase A
MITLFKRQSLRKLASLALAVAGLAMLGYYVFVRVDSWNFQRRAERELASRVPAAPAPAPPTHSAAPSAGPVGRIAIARLGLSAAITEGADDTALRRAVGHIPGTALPGQRGNVGLAGHRDTFFRPLRNVRADDVIVVSTEEGDFRYRVVSTKVVDPHAVEVLNPTEVETLTLVTCYPFFYIGAAPNRFIVRAERIRG